MSKKAQATFIWEHPYLIVRKEAELTAADRDDLALLFAIAPELEVLRRFTQQFYRLFEKGISQQQARYRRTRLLNNPDYQANDFLARAMKKLAKDKFEKMIVFLAWENVDRTNNHVERNNRAFRMLQKTRYKRRKQHTLEKALELELYARMLQHPLYQPKNTPVPMTMKQPACLKMAA
jgi:dynactin complex subunit